MSQFSVQLLGEFAVHRGTERIDLPPACQRLVALIALKRGPAHRLWLCANLWPHVQTHKAIASLRSAIWRLRPVGAGAMLAADPQYLQLAPDVTVDWHRSVDLIGRLLDGRIDAPLVAEALPLLRRGEVLDSWTERWVAPERERYRDMRTKAYDRLRHGAGKHVVHRPTVAECDRERSEP